MRIEEYRDYSGRSPFRDWFNSLDPKSALLINTILTRMLKGNVSNIKSVGNGVFERVIDTGPGYRIYFGMDSKEFIILLLGGTKKKQQKDIEKAKLLWREYKENIRKH